MTAERKVKGSVVQDMVKIVRAFPDQGWDQYLTGEDMDTVKSMILPTAWYPIEFYQRVGLAVYRLVAGSSDEIVASFGKAAMKELFEGPYRPFLDQGDPVLAVRKFMDLRKSLFTFSRMAVEKTGNKEMRITIAELGDFVEGLDIFTVLLGVHIQELVALNGGMDPVLYTSQRMEGGDTVLEYEVSWT